MDGLDKDRDVFRVDVGRNAMTEIEDQRFGRKGFQHRIDAAIERIAGETFRPRID